jgi:FSR family fosmidomycin resistance protein-like MFS transporter
MSFAYLVIEFLDELVFGAHESAWPFLRTDLVLNYAQIGLLMSVPHFVSAFIEPFLGILGDVWKRRTLILGGGVVFSIALGLIALSRDFFTLLLGLMLIFPASGAFVSLSQASLMDLDPARREQNMARWTFAGSIGVTAGPLLLAGMVALGGTWRIVMGMLAVLAALILVFAWKRIPDSRPGSAPLPKLGDVWAGVRGAIGSLRRGEVVRWLVLLEFSDLMLDILLGFLALYFVDAAGLSASWAALAVTLWLSVGLLGDFLLIPLLEKVKGLDYLRISVVLELVLFPAFLLVPNIWAKLVLVSLLGFFNSGWYAILQGNLYKSMHGQSGTVMTLNNLAGLFGKLLPLGIGLAADAWGIGRAVWLLLAGPLVLLVGLPRHYSMEADDDDGKG